MMDSLTQYFRDKIKIKMSDQQKGRWSVSIVHGLQEIETFAYGYKADADRKAFSIACILAGMVRVLTNAGGESPQDGPYSEIRAERIRQVMKGYTPEHDDTHKLGELGCAASVYACPPWMRAEEVVNHVWPFDDTPAPVPSSTENYRSELVKAGALIVAELGRLNRQSAKEQPNDAPDNA